MSISKGTVIYVLGFALALASHSTHADTWSLPNTERYYSANRKYVLKVEPKKLESQLAYFEDKVEGKEDAGSPKGLTNNYCRGTLYRIESDGSRTKLWSTALTNEVAPVHVLVSNSGQRVVTFDNWHNVGYGDNVVAIHGANGELVKKYSLEELLPGGDSNRVRHTISSRPWATSREIDEGRGILFIKVSLWETVRLGNITAVKQGTEETRELRIDLGNGELMKE